jgi:tRNA(fMet)-specific endonuclease VapC
LLDTDWVIHWLNGHSGIRRRIAGLRKHGLGLSLVSLAELYEGVYYSLDPPKAGLALNQFRKGITLIGIDEATCGIFGKERGRLRAARTLIGDFDLLIGAIARRHSLTLLTNNRSHFERIEGLLIESM